MTDKQQLGESQPLDPQGRNTTAMPTASQSGQAHDMQTPPPIYQVRMQPPEPVRPSGPSVPTIILGVLVGLLALALLALGLVFLRYGPYLTMTIPWQRILPFILIGLGVVLIGVAILCWLASSKRTRQDSNRQDVPEDQAAKDGQ